MHRGRGTASRIAWCDAPARERGVRAGQTLAAARARCPELASALLDPERLARARREVVARLLACTPRIAPDGDARFWVEPAPLGDLAAWREEVRDALAGLGELRLGIGPWALVAYAAALEDAGEVLDPEAFLDACAPAVLELPPATLETLRALGIRRLAALRALDPPSLGARLGPEAARARRWMDGDDPRGPRTPRDRADPRVEVRLEDPVDAIGPLLFLIRPAIAQLLRDPVGRGEGVIELTLELDHDRSAPRTLTARSAHPIGDPTTLFELLRAVLDAPSPLGPPSLGPSPLGPSSLAPEADAVVGFSLRAARTSPLPEPTEPLIGPPPRRAATEVAVARLTSRLGEGAVVRAARVEAASPFARAAWTREAPRPGPALPWRGEDPPAPIADGLVRVAGRLRRVLRRGRIERALHPWWDDGALRVERLAWLEVEGPLLVLARERRDARPPVWEAIAWID